MKNKKDLFLIGKLLFVTACMWSIIVMTLLYDFEEAKQVNDAERFINYVETMRGKKIPRAPKIRKAGNQ